MINNELINKVNKEYQEKLNNLDPKNIATYMMITTYLLNEKIDEKYSNFLLEQENTIDYLFKVFLESNAELNYYRFVCDALKLDQKAFLTTEKIEDNE